MSIYVKPILFGTLFGLMSGIIGYFANVLYLSIGQGVTESSELVELLRSKEAMYWSIPFSFLALLISSFISSRKLHTGHYLVTFVVALVVCLSITLGPLKIISIHMNYLPILIGSLTGAYLAKKINKASQQGGSETPTSAGRR